MLSLRRTLAVRFSLTMFVALVLIAGWAVLAGRALLNRDLDAAGVGQLAAAMVTRGITRDVLWLMGTTVALATVVTMFGAGWLARRATRPVAEIAEQARAVTPVVTGQRITAHADVAEFQDLVQVLNAMLARLDQGIASQRRLIADAGHDLKTPLTAMRGQIEVALRGTRSPEEYRGVLTSVLDEVEHLTALSDSLLVLARLDADELRPRLEPVDAATLLDRVARRWTERLGARTIRVHVPAEGLELRGDERLLDLALDQLFDNIRHHTPEGTSVTASAIQAEDETVLAISDDGPGQSPEALPFLFDRFFRSDASRTRSAHAGAGLGLTLVQGIATAHGGTAHAAPREGGGLDITLRFPRPV